MAFQLDTASFSSIMDTVSAGLTAGFGFGSAVVGARSNNNPANANYTGGQAPTVYYQVPDNRQAPQAPQPQPQAPQNAGMPIWAWLIIALLFAAVVGFAIYKRRGA